MHSKHACLFALLISAPLLVAGQEPTVPREPDTAVVEEAPPVKTAQPEPPAPPFIPSEKVTADTIVAFPIDI